MPRLIVLLPALALIAADARAWQASSGPAVEPGPSSSAPATSGAASGALSEWMAQQEVFRAALEAVAPVIVRIDTVGGAQPVASQGGPMAPPITAPTFRQADGPTTGVIWSSDGLILTSAFNFMRDPTVITVTLADGRRFVARLLARDRVTRLALLKVDAADLPAPQWAAADELRVGRWALAAGFGHGTSAPALSVGVISGLNRMAGLALQTDAKISPANYGGPLFDCAGRLLGVCVPMGMGEDDIAGFEWYDSGIGFAITHDVIAPRVPRLAEGQTLERGMLGVQVDTRVAVVGGDWPPSAADADARPFDRPRRSASGPASDEAPDEGPLPDDVGVRVAETPSGPAAEAGVLAGDRILTIDGAPTPTRLALRRVLARKVAGDTVQVELLGADGARRTAEIALALASAPPPPPPADEPPSSAPVPDEALPPANPD